MKLARQVLQWSVQSNIYVPVWNAVWYGLDGVVAADSDALRVVARELFK